jgi:AcrR family transcriptional regulator
MTAYRTVAASSRAGHTRDSLLKAAKTLLLRGRASITVEDICLAAGVSKGGFYHHFPDKDSVFLEVALRELVREMELSTPLAAGTSALDTPDRRGASFLLIDLWAWASRRPQGRRRVQVAHRKALKRLAQLPGRVASGEPSGGDREAQATLALFVAIGRVVRRAAQRPLAMGESRQRKAAYG